LNLIRKCTLCIMSKFPKRKGGTTSPTAEGQVWGKEKKDITALRQRSQARIMDSRPRKKRFCLLRRGGEKGARERKRPPRHYKRRELGKEKNDWDVTLPKSVLEGLLPFPPPKR